MPFTTPNHRRWSLLQAVILLAFGVSLFGCGGYGSSTPVDLSAPFHYFYVYTANTGSNNISEFQGNQDGTLTFLGTVPCPAAPTKLTTLHGNLYAISSDKIMAFSGADSGSLNLKQTLILRSGGKTYSPICCAARVQVAQDVLYVLGSTTGTAQGFLQKYTIQNDGTLLTAGSISGFNGPAAMAANISISLTTEYILVANKNDNTATLVTDRYQMPMVLSQTISLPGGKTSNPVGIQNEPETGFYVADALNGKITHVAVKESTRDNPLDGIKVVKSLNAGHPICLGTTRKLGSIFEYFAVPSVLLTIDSDLGIVEGFTPYNGSYSVNTQFQWVPGTAPNSGSCGVAIDGIAVLNDHVHGVGYGYSASSSGAIREYRADKSGVAFVASYDSQGSGIQDLVVTAEVGAMPPLTLAPATLTSGTQGSSFSQEFVIGGGDTSKKPSLTLTKGNLPPGLKLVATDHSSGHDAILNGVPTSAGVFSFTLTAQRGTFKLDRSYTVTISVSTDGVYAEFVNATTNAVDAPLVGIVSGINLQAGQNTISDNFLIPIGTDNLKVNRSGGQLIASKSFRTVSATRYVLLAVGNPTDGYDVIQDQFDLGSKPGIGTSWFTFYPGVKGLTETVDFYLVLPGSNIGSTPYKVTGVAPLTTTQTITVTNAGSTSATLYATEPGQPTNVIAQQTLVLSAGSSTFGTLVSPEKGAARFTVVTDHLR